MIIPIFPIARDDAIMSWDFGIRKLESLQESIATIIVINNFHTANAFNYAFIQLTLGPLPKHKFKIKHLKVEFESCPIISEDKFVNDKKFKFYTRFYKFPVLQQVSMNQSMN